MYAKILQVIFAFMLFKQNLLVGIVTEWKSYIVLSVFLLFFVGEKGTTCDGFDQEESCIF